MFTNIGPATVPTVWPTPLVPTDASPTALPAIRAMLAITRPSFPTGLTRQHQRSVLANHDFSTSHTMAPLIIVLAKISRWPAAVSTYPVRYAVHADPAAFTTVLAMTPLLVVLANASSLAHPAIVFLDAMFAQRSLSLLRQRITRHRQQQQRLVSTLMHFLGTGDCCGG